MIDDTERRDVARRLREKKAECEERGYQWMCDDLILALGYDHDYEAGDEVFDLLADLIEPSCDRDALLALADEFDGKADYIASCIESMDGDLDRHAIEAEAEQREYARRIREALGVER